MDTYDHMLKQLPMPGRKAVKRKVTRYTKKYIEDTLDEFYYHFSRIPTQKEFGKGIKYHRMLQFHYRTACRHLGQTPKEYLMAKLKKSEVDKKI